MQIAARIIMARAVVESIYIRLSVFIFLIKLKTALLNVMEPVKHPKCPNVIADIRGEKSYSDKYGFHYWGRMSGTSLRPICRTYNCPNISKVIGDHCHSCKNGTTAIAVRNRVIIYTNVSGKKFWRTVTEDGRVSITYQGTTGRITIPLSD